LLADDPERRPKKTATDRAVEAIEAAERMFAGEMGATLDLSPAAKLALIATIAAAIQAAVAEEGQKLTWVL
jgi:rhamnose utilization protein RhaD (predicted bifunctional aldolase and dehydrogenase)